MNRQPGNIEREICRVDAWAIADATGVAASPGSLLLDVGDDITVLAVGTPDVVDRHPAAAGAAVHARHRSVIIPGLVNAHTHLDLTHIGPQPHDPDLGFIPWVDRIREARLTDDAAIAASVRRGVQLARAGGTVAVGDIAGAMSLAPLRALRRAGMAGVAFQEFFAIGNRESAALEMLQSFVRDHRAEINAGSPARFGLQPHAPYTVSRAGYAAACSLAAAHGWPLATHLAETPEERAFIGAAEGPQRELLERLGIWEDRILDEAGQGRSPIEHLAPVLTDARGMLAAHVNDIDDVGLELLARSGVMVVYCPRASSYFGAPDRFGAHRYQDMLNAGIPVALGTDSIVNLPPAAADADAGGISTLDEMRVLHARDALDPTTALAMGTIHGAAALGLDASAFAWRAGASPLGVAAVEVEPTGDPLEAVMRSNRPARLMVAARVSVE